MLYVSADLVFRDISVATSIGAETVKLYEFSKQFKFPDICSCLLKVNIGSY